MIVHDIWASQMKNQGRDNFILRLTSQTFNSPQEASRFAEAIIIISFPKNLPSRISMSNVLKSTEVIGTCISNDSKSMVIVDSDGDDIEMWWEENPGDISSKFNHLIGKRVLFYYDYHGIVIKEVTPDIELVTVTISGEVPGLRSMEFLAEPPKTYSWVRNS